MKRLSCSLLTVLCLLALPGLAQDVYVSLSGNDSNAGTISKPLATVNAALRKVRESRRTASNSLSSPIQIIVQPGVYQLKEPIFIRPEDSGTPQSPTIIRSSENAATVMSGGIPINGFRQNAKGWWEADLPFINGQPFSFRQLYVNGRKATRARQTTGNEMLRIISWNKKAQTCVIPKPKQVINNIEGLEFFIHQWWAIAILRVRSLQVQGDSAIVSFHQPESRIQSEHPWPAPWISEATGNSGFFLSNHLAFLDEPGEWYHDERTHKLYYYPRKGETIRNASVIAPMLDNLIVVQGTPDRPVSHIQIKGLQFQHTTWLRPSQQGHVPHQNGLFMTDAYRLRPVGTELNPNLDNQAWVGRPSAALQLDHANDIRIADCRFEHIGATAIDANKGIHRLHIEGNLLKDISGNGILAGVYADPSMEIHLPYDPADQREVCDSLVIRNNLITDATNEDWSCVGIGLGYTRNSLVAHNEVENVSYTGISMGWGWTPLRNAMRNNTLRANYIHHYGKHNYDCAGIYTLSAQPGSIIESNRIDSIYLAPYAHLPSHWFYLYNDEGSSYFTVQNNWTSSTKFLRNANGPGNVWSNNGPSVSNEIYSNAGLQRHYQYLQKDRTAQQQQLPVNEKHLEAIELIAKPGTDLYTTAAKLRRFLAEQQLDSTGIYQWKTHFLVYVDAPDIAVLEGRLVNRFPELTVKVYHDLFYAFRKKNHCTDTTTAREWTHTILTANLVADTKKQNEYLQYHARQFKQWPEVSQGFCNADFQELLLLRRGRQLVLVISTPKGVSLDELNPKTTANNPRMIEWNKIMQQYQEGIEGTDKGETWVFMQQLK